MRMKAEVLASTVAQLRSFVPYAAIELIMPGGSVLALLLWLYRRKTKADIHQGRCSNLKD
jgi:hypothetical protein